MPKECIAAYQDLFLFLYLNATILRGDKNNHKRIQNQQMAGLFSLNHEVFRKTPPAFRKNRQYRLLFLRKNRQLANHLLYLQAKEQEP